MPSFPTGDVIGANRRIRTPGALDWTDGTPLDAGTATILSSNIHHLQAESLRHLVASVGPGVVHTGKGRYEDIKDRAPSNQSFLDKISWSLFSAKVFGPFDIVADRERSAGVLGLRIVRVSVDVHTAALFETGPSLVVYAALTPFGQMPGSAEGATLTGLAKSGAIGRSTLVLNLQSDEPFVLAGRRIARRDPSGNTTQASVAELALWVGWDSAHVDDYIISINAFEVR